MATFRELLANTKQRITEIDPETAEARLGGRRRSSMSANSTSTSRA